SRSRAGGLSPRTRALFTRNSKRAVNLPWRRPFTIKKSVAREDQSAGRAEMAGKVWRSAQIGVAAQQTDRNFSYQPYSFCHSETALAMRNLLVHCKKETADSSDLKVLGMTKGYLIRIWTQRKRGRSPRPLIVSCNSEVELQRKLNQPRPTIIRRCG